MEKCGSAGQVTSENIMRCIRCACWIIKTTDTHTEYVIFITFPLQQWLRERASILRYTYTFFLVVLLSSHMHLGHASIFFDFIFPTQVLLCMYKASVNELITSLGHSIKASFFSGVTTYGLVAKYKSFGRACCLHYHANDSSEKLASQFS